MRAVDGEGGDEEVSEKAPPAAASSDGPGLPRGDGPNGLHTSRVCVGALLLAASSALAGFCLGRYPHLPLWCPGHGHAHGHAHGDAAQHGGILDFLGGVGEEEMEAVPETAVPAAIATAEVCAQFCRKQKSKDTPPLTAREAAAHRYAAVQMAAAATLSANAVAMERGELLNHLAAKVVDVKTKMDKSDTDMQHYIGLLEAHLHYQLVREDERTETGTMQLPEGNVSLGAVAKQMDKLDHSVTMLLNKVVASMRRVERIVRRTCVKHQHSGTDGVAAKGPHTTPPPLQAATCKSTELAKVPKDWCDSTFEKPCSTSVEYRYMNSNDNLALRRGLQALREGTCFPFGVAVAALGYNRGGSSALFNVARLWATLASGEGVISGLSCIHPLRASSLKALEAAKIATPPPPSNCTLVCHDSAWHESLGSVNSAKTIDVAIASHGDVLEAVCKRRTSELWCRDPSLQLPKSEQADFVKKCRADDEMGKDEAARQCRKLMQGQADLYFQRHIIGKDIAYDFSLDEFAEDPVGQIMAVGQAMGICGEATNNVALVTFINAMMKQLADRPALDVPISRIHEHRADQVKAEAQCGPLKDWLRMDEQCAAWMDSNAAAQGNSLLKAMLAAAGLPVQYVGARIAHAARSANAAAGVAGGAPAQEVQLRAAATIDQEKAPVLYITETLQGGKYFAFDAADGDRFFGREDWDQKRFLVERKNDLIVVIVFREAAFCKRSCGRVYPKTSANVDDWTKGNAITRRSNAILHHTCTTSSQLSPYVGLSGQTQQVCELPSIDGHVLPWILFGDINSTSNNFGEDAYLHSPTRSGYAKGNSVQVGTLTAGAPGAPGYSLDLQQLISYSGNGSSRFDLMIQFGGDAVFSHAFYQFSKTDGHLINNKNMLSAANAVGEHGMWGSADDGKSGYYATFCALKGRCATGGHDFWSFSTDGRYPRTAGTVICGFHFAGWKDCVEGDNVHRMRYYIRFHPLTTDIAYRTLGTGRCLDYNGQKFNVLESSSCQPLELCRLACNYFPFEHCRGFNVETAGSCGACTLSMDAAFTGGLAGWNFTASGDQGRGEALGTTERDEDIVCYRRLPGASAYPPPGAAGAG